jgi:hypothetical protein
MWRGAAQSYTTILVLSAHLLHNLKMLHLTSKRLSVSVNVQNARPCAHAHMLLGSLVLSIPCGRWCRLHVHSVQCEHAEALVPTNCAAPVSSTIGTTDVPNGTA